MKFGWAAPNLAKSAKYVVTMGQTPEFNVMMRHPVYSDGILTMVDGATLCYDWHKTMLSCRLKDIPHLKKTKKARVPTLISTEAAAAAFIWFNCTSSCIWIERANNESIRKKEKSVENITYLYTEKK